MRVPAFLIGMVGSTGVVSAAAAWSGFSAWAVAGFAAATMVLSQVLYLALILLMVKEESDSRQEADTARAPADSVIQMHEPHPPNV